MSSLKTYEEEIFEREELEKAGKKVLLTALKKVNLPKQVLKADLYTQKSTKKGNFLRKILKKGFKKVFSLKKYSKKYYSKSGSKKFLLLQHICSAGPIQVSHSINALVWCL